MGELSPQLCKDRVMKKLILFLALTITSINNISADGVMSLQNTQSLVSLCSQGEDTASFLVCVSYIQGVFDTFMISLDELNLNTQCYNENSLIGVTPYQLSKIFVKYISNHPENLNIAPADLLINAVILQNFPIPKQCYPK